MPGRSFRSEDYRFAFNGKENDNEVKGTGNQVDYGLRLYDSWVRRFRPIRKKVSILEFISIFRKHSNKI